jgi:cytochrome P450
MMATLKNEKYFDNVVEELIAGIDKNFASISKVCDWTAWSEYFAYDMITDYVFGKAFGFCKSATDVNGGIRDLRQMLNLSPLLSYMPWIWGLTKNENIKKAGNSHYSKSTRKEITSRLDNGNQSGRYDLLQGLIEARYPDGSPLPLGEITNHSYIFLLAAPDTVSVALRKILMNLIQNPTVHKELLAQLVAADLSKRPTWKELSTIPLLAAIVKESLRLHPPAGFTLPREVPTGGRNLCGYFIPEGTTVGMSAWCVHHNDTFFGPDASEFKPERWLDEKTSMDLEKYTLNFGQGARGCLGKNIAMVQLVKAVAQLVLNFDFEIVDAHKVKSVFVLLVVIDNLKIRFSRRKGGPLDDTVGML